VHAHALRLADAVRAVLCLLHLRTHSHVWRPHGCGCGSCIMHGAGSTHGALVRARLGRPAGQAHAGRCRTSLGVQASSANTTVLARVSVRPTPAARMLRMATWHGVCAGQAGAHE
jgi:hypothetical protein